MRYAPARLCDARAARRLLCRRRRIEEAPGHAPPRDPRHVRALSRHPDRTPCRPFPALARPQAAVVATIVSDADAYADPVVEALKAAGVSAVVDKRNAKRN